MVAICLGPALPPGSSDQPEDRPGTYRPPTWSCSGRGLPSRPVTRPLVRTCRTISPLPRVRPFGKGVSGGVLPAYSGPGRYVSVALSVGSPLLGVTQRPCPVELGLSSPRPSGEGRRATTRPTGEFSVEPPQRQVKPTSKHAT